MSSAVSTSALVTIWYLFKASFMGSVSPSLTDSVAPAEPFRLRVLVVAYYFPPMGLSGVQRVAKFVKYLPDFDWQPTVLTVEPGAYYAFDESLLEELEAREGIEIVRTESADPTRLFAPGKLVKMPSERRRRVFSWLSQLLYVPDTRIGWKKPAVDAGKAIMDQHAFDVIFASAPPYTSLLVGLELSRYGGVPLVADFRDDWLGNPRHAYPTPLHRKRHARLEAEVVQNSSVVTTVNRVIQDRLIARHLGPRGYNKVTHLPHGFDPADFHRSPPPRSERTFRIVYSGVFYDAQRPDSFLKALRIWCDRNPEGEPLLEARFVGLVPDRTEELVDVLNLSHVVQMTGYVPHDRAVEELLNADVLWMTVGHQKGEETIGTSKLCEYFGTRKPILGLVPDGAAKSALQEYGASVLANPDDEYAIAAGIDTLFRAFRSGKLPEPDEEFVTRHNRKRLTGELAGLFRGTLRTE